MKAYCLNQISLPPICCAVGSVAMSLYYNSVSRVFLSIFASKTKPIYEIHTKPQTQNHTKCTPVHFRVISWIMSLGFGDTRCLAVSLWGIYWTLSLGLTDEDKLITEE